MEIEIKIDFPDEKELENAQSLFSGERQTVLQRNVGNMFLF